MRIRLDRRKLMRRHTPPARTVLVGVLSLATMSGCAPERPPDRAPDQAVADHDPPVGADGTDRSFAVVDAAGRELAFARPATRIVSLVPSATATLRAIGAEGTLVGRTDFDRDGWTTELPSVGGGLGPSLEAIVALDPDLVVSFAGDQDPRTRDRLEDLGIPYLNVRPDGVSDIFETARLLGRATGHDEAADSLVRALRAGLDEAERAVQDWPRLSFAYVLGGTPPWVAGPGTYIHEILSVVGGDNAFADLDALYAPISPEELRRRHVDVVLVSARGEYDESLTPDARIVEVGDAFEMPGPDVVLAARRVAELMHGRTLR